MGEWKRVKLGEIIECFDSMRKPLSSIQRSAFQGQYRYYGAQEVIDYVDGYIFDGTYVLIAEDGENLISRKKPIAQIVSGRFWLNNHAHIFKANEKSDLRYLCYFLNSSDITYYVTGSAQPKLSRQNLDSIELDLPPLPTQRRIAAVLGALDDKIEVNRKICENLEAQAQALFKAWFVDFEPFGGKRPEGWKMGKLGDVAEVTSGKRPPTRSDIADGESVFPLLGAAAIMGFTSQYMFDEPILVTGRVGTHGVIQRSFGRSWPSDNTLVIRAKRFEFVYQILKRIDYGKMNRGSTQPLITQSDLKGVEILIPDEALLNQFEEAVAPLMRLQYDKLQESRILAVMRDALLPKLMSGELAVEKVEVK